MPREFSGAGTEAVVRSLRRGDRPLRLRQAVVASVNGGVANIRLADDDTPVPARALGWYQPVVGDSVWVLENQPDLLIVGPLEDSWTDITNFATGWSPHNPLMYGTPAWRKEGNYIQLRGMLDAVSPGTTVFSLGVGTNPPIPTFDCQTATHGRISDGNDGVIGVGAWVRSAQAILHIYAPTNVSWVSLASIRYPLS